MIWIPSYFDHLCVDTKSIVGLALITHSCFFMSNINSISSPFFSIVTISLNDRDGLYLTYKSILSQLFQDFEWIVIDGQSSDGTQQFLASLNFNPLIWKSELDDGIYDAMNSGISLARGKYTIFMNAGDIFYANDILSLVFKVLKSPMSIDILFGGCFLELFRDHRVYRRPTSYKKSIWHGLPAIHQSTFYKTSLIKENPYEISYQVCGDYYLCSTLALQAPREHVIDSPLSIFRLGGISSRRIIPLFAEPYRIQRDVLGLPFLVRIVSLLKRFISTVGLKLMVKSVQFSWFVRSALR